MNELLHYKFYELRIDKFGTKRYYLNGSLYRVIYSNGLSHWYLNGNFHRENGPAIEYKDGYSAWYYMGLRHRIGGPAVIRANGDKEYWKHGIQQFTTCDWCRNGF